MKKTQKIKEQKTNKQKKSNQWNIFKALNQKIIGMGYSYSIPSFLKNFLIFSILIFCLGYFHKLDWMYIVMLIIAFFIMLPFSVYAQYKYLYEQKRFQELCLYLKQMKINFKTYKKILTALEETLTVFEESDRIFPYISQAIESIKGGSTYKEALNLIETPYKNSYIIKLHAFMVLGEEEGGESVYQALDNIDYANWQTDTFIFMTQKYKYQNQNGYFSIFSLLISLAVVFMFQYIFNTSGDVLSNVFTNMTFQLETFLYIFVVLMSYICIKTLITSKWIREDE